MLVIRFTIIVTSVFHARDCSYVLCCYCSYRKSSVDPAPAQAQQAAPTGGGNMRYKRDTLHDMTRPLKQWLYKNKNNPYPTKQQKVKLAEDSKMTLVQVRNNPYPTEQQKVILAGDSKMTLVQVRGSVRANKYSCVVHVAGTACTCTSTNAIGSSTST